MSTPCAILTGVDVNRFARLRTAFDEEQKAVSFEANFRRASSKDKGRRCVSECDTPRSWWSSCWFPFKTTQTEYTLKNRQPHISLMSLRAWTAQFGKFIVQPNSVW